jgi:hypothetical protein
MGGVRGATANGGFESWAVRPVAPPPPTTPPDGGATPSLSGFVFVDYNYDGVPDVNTDSLNEALAGVVVHLQGTDDQGNPVDLVTTTGADGSYSFTGLRAGNYTLWQEQPDNPNLADGPEYLGGVLVNESGTDQFSVSLSAGQTAANYNFSEYWME